MPQIDLMKHETEQKLQDALNTMLDFLSLNHSPKDALVKAAKVHKLSKDQIRVVARAYNTGLVLNQLKQDDIQKRASVPNLVDPEAAIKELFIHPVKETKISSDYAYEPKFDKPKHDYSGQIKAAAALNRIQRQARYFDSEYEDETTRLKRKYQELSEQRRQAFLKLEKVAKELVNYFYSKDPIAPNELIKNASIICGNDVKIIFDIIKPEIPKTHFNEFQPVNWEKPPYSIIKEAVAYLRDVIRLNKELAKIPKHIYQKPVENYSILRATKDNVIDQMRQDSCLTELLLTKKAQDDDDDEDEEEPSGIRKAISTVKDVASKIESKINPVSAFETVKTLAEFYPKPKSISVSMLADTESQYKLNQKKVAVILADLTRNDEIISRHKSEDVIKAYNELAKLAPIAMQSPTVIRTMLRKYLETNGSLDEYTLDQITKIEKELSRINSRVTNELFTAPTSVPTSISL